jgi:glutamate/tyrosine decarboxylase-like PLP-dependent enzyme
MQSPRDAASQSFEKALQGIRQLSAFGAVPAIAGAGTRALEAWFLGPKGENAEVLERLVVEAIRDQAFWRRNYHPGDPTHITEEIRRSPEYVEAMDALNEGYRGLLAFLKKSVPFFSMRYQGHMNWDLTIPGILGYFAAMLYNPNNVAFEGSTATTILEILVGDDLCRMLGYTIPEQHDVGAGPPPGVVRPWGHITCDGTVANIEALWSARNLKLFPLALHAALTREQALATARDIVVPLPTGVARPLVQLDTWSLLNLKGDDILALPARLTAEYGIERETVTKAIAAYSLQNLGMQEFARQFLGEITQAPLFLVSGTKHYSFPKAAALLGIGATNMIDVPVDEDARMHIPTLRQLLQTYLTQRRPVYTVVAVIGTTEESAVDPLSDVLALREEFRRQGLEFTVHADAAWGGYHASVVREDFDMPQPVRFAGAPPLFTPLSQYVTRQFQALGGADSITVDPHKSGYIPYPAGALCYRNSAMRDLVTFSAPVVFHGTAEPTVGIYGIEGSKPGAAASAVYLSHRIIRPSQSGYGKIIGQALFSCKRLYARLLCMAGPEDRFIAVPLARLPDGIPGATEEEKIAFVRNTIDSKTNAQLLNDTVARQWLSELGPDENILAYAFNFRRHDGSGWVVNQDMDLMNRLNRALYDRLSINPGEDIYGYDLIVSTTDLHVEQYGETFIKSYARRLGVTQPTGNTITVLRSVVMDPWVTETSQGSFIDVLEQEFRKAIASALEEITPARIRGY